MYKKKTILQRVSNRTYLPKLCKKPECNEGFIPTDARQVYCCEQHRIDFNNDQRKLKESIDISFLKIIKKNRAILHKIALSDFYIKSGFASKSLLEYERYDFTKYHKIMINKITENDIHICYDYALELTDPINKNFSIKII